MWTKTTSYDKGFTAKQDGEDLDIRSGSTFISISKEDILNSPTDAMFIAKWFESVLQEAGK